MYLAAFSTQRNILRILISWRFSQNCPESRHQNLQDEVSDFDHSTLDRWLEAKQSDRNFLLPTSPLYPSQGRHYSMNSKYETSLGAPKLGLPKDVISVFEACLVFWKKIILYLRTPLKWSCWTLNITLSAYILIGLTDLLHKGFTIITQPIWSILKRKCFKRHHE